MGLSMEGKETTLPGVVISVVLTVAMWLGAFYGGWHLGLALTGSEIGGAAGAVFPVLAREMTFKVWTS